MRTVWSRVDIFELVALVIVACRLVSAEDIKREDTIQPIDGSPQMQPQDADMADFAKDTGRIRSERSEESGCPAPFKYLSTVKGCYYVVNDNLEWDIAVIRCRSLHRDAHLVVIDNAQEQAAVAGLLAWHTSMGLVGQVTSGYFWTAAKRVDRTRLSTFVWRTSLDMCCSVDAVKEMKYTHWGPGEPNNFTHSLDACGILVRSYNYAWADAPCSYVVGAVCEIDL